MTGQEPIDSDTGGRVGLTGATHVPGNTAPGGGASFTDGRPPAGRVTPQERAARIAAWLDRADAPPGVVVLLKERVEREIEAAIAQEREACAKIADDAHRPDWYKKPFGHPRTVAAAIRARGEPAQQNAPATRR